MVILLIGQGGREHALAHALCQSPSVSRLYIAPGNPGTATAGIQALNLHIKATDYQGITAFCTANPVDLVVIGPEQPLVDGLADQLRSIGIPVLGPGAAGARLEGSKAFSKAFMLRHGIPTAAARIFGRNELDSAIAYVNNQPLPVVIKADGLAAGKGVVVAKSHAEARQALTDMLASGLHGQAADNVLVEEGLHGIEMSCFVLTDGIDYMLLPEAKDYKRIFDNDEGPNTGGMGAVSPVPFFDERLRERVERQIIASTLAGLREEGIPYIGILFIGLMVSPDGAPYVIEYNARLGDPETQAILPRLEGDLAALFLATAQGNLAAAQHAVSIRPVATCAIIAAALGYPGPIRTGDIITLPLEGTSSQSRIYQAGTRLVDGKLVTDGGRILACVGLGANAEAARQNATATIANVNFDGMQYRKDINLDLQALTKK